MGLRCGTGPRLRGGSLGSVTGPSLNILQLDRVRLSNHLLPPFPTRMFSHNTAWVFKPSSRLPRKISTRFGKQRKSLHGCYFELLAHYTGLATEKEMTERLYKSGNVLGGLIVANFHSYIWTINGYFTIVIAVFAAIFIIFRWKFLVPLLSYFCDSDNND